MMLDDIGRRRCWFSKRLKNTDKRHRANENNANKEWSEIRMSDGITQTHTKKCAVLHSTQWARTLTIRMDQYVQCAYGYVWLENTVHSIWRWRMFMHALAEWQRHRTRQRTHERCGRRDDGEMKIKCETSNRLPTIIVSTECWYCWLRMKHSKKTNNNNNENIV